MIVQQLSWRVRSAGWAGAPVVDDSEEAEGEANTESHGDGVLGVGCHALEDLPRADDGRHNHRQPRAGQHDISSSTGGVGGTCVKCQKACQLRVCQDIP